MASKALNLHIGIVSMAQLEGLKRGLLIRNAYEEIHVTYEVINNLRYQSRCTVPEGN